MEQSVQDELAAIVAKDAWTAEDHKRLLGVLSSFKDAARRFQAAAADIEAAHPNATGAAALKVGIARYTRCRFPEALEALARATDNKDRRYFQAQCFKNLRQWDRALEELGLALDRGWDALEIALEQVEVQALAGDAGAAKALGKIEKKAGDSAEYAYLTGLVAEIGGQGAQAVEAYERALERDPGHVKAIFRLAYHHDLHGDEETALELYQQCVSRPPIHANALLNMAVLHEDAGRYDRAAACIRRVLATNPNHPRAKLFLKDVGASMSMYYDEDRARWIAMRNAVLDIPVTDFELSVRARNCLKKMNIRTLGDLVRTTESELLGYKNFGETSLLEIKEMLTAKGLSLGEGSGLEELPADGPAAAPLASVSNEGVLATPIAQVDFSIRARKALEILDVHLLGDLAAKTEGELLACKNFGQTSLVEVRQRLGEYGLALREP